MAIVDEITDIESAVSRDPDIRGGRPCVAGTGVSILRIAIWHKMGNSAEEIARQISHLTLAQVQVALKWYFANKAEIDRDIEEDERETLALEAAHRR